MSNPVDVVWFGDRSVLVTADDRLHSAALARVLSARFPDRLVRQGMRSVLVEAATPSPGLLDLVLEAVGDVGIAVVSSVVSTRTVVVDVHYDGADLRSAAEALGVTADALAAAHVDQPWRVAMMGFAPGFGYLVPDGESLIDWAALARRQQPRAEVPSGSVAIAAGMSAVYPARMPGGWHLIGRTDAAVFDPHRSVPALLAPDDIVRFRASA